MAITNKSKLSEYRCWLRMKDRCLKKDDKNYYNYGARGITVSKEWLDFECFYNDMGSRPSMKHCLDRIDNDKGYEKGNVRWTTRDINNRNKRNNIWLEYNGRKMILKDWAREYGISYQALQIRLKNGMPMETALTQKKFLMPQRIEVEYNGRIKIIKEWAKELGMSSELLGNRLRRWKDVKKAFETPVLKKIKVKKKT